MQWEELLLLLRAPKSQSFNYQEVCILLFITLPGWYFLKDLCKPKRAEAQKHIKEILSPGLYVNLLRIVRVV